MGVTALGGWALGLAFVVAGASAVASGDGARRGRPSSVDWGRRGLVAVFGLASVGLVALAWALVTEDYSLVYVADNASRDTTWPYRLAGLWGGMSGSLLLWTWMLAGWSLLASRSVRRRRPELAGGTQAVLALEAAVFLGLLVTVSRPFATLAVPAIDGGGLTPILRHPAMLYHPPLLYAGYVGLAVPAAIAVAALTSAAGAARDWIGVARRFMVPSLVLLAVGLTAGAHWAYVELGWGGYWAWDPVENGALLPWLAGIAFLHSALLATRRPGLWPEPVAGRLPRAKDPAASPPLDGLWRESVAGRPLRAKDAAAHPALDGLGRETGASRPRRDTDAGAGPAGDGLWRETGASRPPRDKDAGAGPVADGLSRETGATRPQRDKDRDGGGLAAAGLAFLAFGLSLLGAFLTRSGVTASVHAFAEARAV
ncbi:MAG: cytochrome c-type biosis protein CcmF, partial [Actinomycetota bacterium]|nr:cytochrome c-type biosis protein CcmF [Actinomycetota bacterium]